VAHLVRLLKDGVTPGPSERADLARILGEPDRAIDAWMADRAAVAACIDRLLDQHGTGRVMFRNTRATIAGFPARAAHLHPLPIAGAAGRRALASEWAAEASDSGESRPDVSVAHDPRVDWLVTLLQALAPHKVLLLCRTEQKAVAIERALRHRTTIPMASFHEGLTLVQRDRGAASFADPDGVRLLIGSEIGSEGRNFQFAHHLVLFDLPLDPALIEQRIGRLDRIGQREAIHVHVPVIQGSHLDVLARWYHEGLNAFEAHVPGAGELCARFRPDLLDLVGRMQTDRAAAGEALDRFIPRVQEARRQVAARLDRGRDRLLEWNSLRPALSAQLVEEIHRQDEDHTLDAFMLEAFDLFFIQVEEIAPRTWRLGSAGVLVDDFPGLTAEGLTCTRDRARALRREDLQFLTWDHPLATGALDLLLGSERGNCAFARWQDPGVSALYLEALYLLECLAPAALHVDRFLPPTPLRIVIDHRGRDVTGIITRDGLARDSRPAGGQALAARADVRETLLPRMLDRAGVLAAERIPGIVDDARRGMHARLQHEATRLRELQRVNRSVRDEEIALLLDQEDALDRAIGGARLRLDAVRLVYRGR
jgi:ATP-dependent helicase HepA